MSDVRVLSCHAEYRCRHAGACCTSNWPIPVEADRLGQLQAAIATRRLQPAGDASRAIQFPIGAPADSPAVLGRTLGMCAFHDLSVLSGGRCRIHAAVGHEALPLACRQFPRISVHDPRGVSVTLSHYCPTAAALLDAGGGAPLTIAGGGAAFPATGEYVGLDARDALPPLLRRDMLMDWAAWWECERLAVAALDGDADVSVAIARLRSAVADLETWSPADGPLIDRVRTAFSEGPPAGASVDSVRTSRLVDAVFAAIPADIRPRRFAAVPQPSDLAIRRFLAAHAFANWRVHSRDGIAGWLRSIESASALIEAGAGVRHADLLLRHLVQN